MGFRIDAPPPAPVPEPEDETARRRADAERRRRERGGRAATVNPQRGGPQPANPVRNAPGAFGGGLGRFGDII
ncbi:MAG: hypothetical protein Tsb0010_08900 [Parvularculaceae bacterium]